MFILQGELFSGLSEIAQNQKVSGKSQNKDQNGISYQIGNDDSFQVIATHGIEQQRIGDRNDAESDPAFIGVAQHVKN